MTRGFTLLEAMVAAVIMVVGLAAVIGGFGSVANIQAKGEESEDLARLLETKFQELLATQEYESVSEGDLADLGYESLEWSVERQPTQETDLEVFVVTLFGDFEGRFVEVSRERLVYVAPEVEEPLEVSE